MNEIYFLTPSNLKESQYFIRLINSIDIHENIHVIFLNQSEKFHYYDFISPKKCSIEEICLGKVMPLSQSRNIGLDYLKEQKYIYKENALVMFMDDDAWFPSNTIDELLKCQPQCYSLKTIDPETNKSFKKVKSTVDIVRGYHLICDIVSICLVIPMEYILKFNPRFNEKLGLGNDISQGEESLFIYNLSKNGYDVYLKELYVYHPYKLTYNLKNYYSLSYFWALGLFHISPMFFVPCVKYLFKYTVALGLIIKNTRYFKIFKNVWHGFFDGMFDKGGVINEKSSYYKKK